jgi:hypothetical protein
MFNDEVVLPGAYKDNIGKVVDLKDENGNVVGTATVLDGDGTVEYVLHATGRKAIANHLMVALTDRYSYSPFAMDD